MKILVTGATGLVGRNLLPLLKDNGHEVIALTRNTDTAGVRLPIACQIVHWDPTTQTPLPDFPENINPFLKYGFLHLQLAIKKIPAIRL
jgi:nucleoside-diphosphate-sugar epimerase